MFVAGQVEKPERHRGRGGRPDRLDARGDTLVAMNAPTLSVIVPNYRRPDLLIRCLESLRDGSANTQVKVEVIVVDDGSGDESCQLVREGFPEVALVALERNGGYPGAVNAGIEVSTGEWLLTLNNDTVVDREALGSLLAVARSSSDIGSVAAQQRFLSHPQVIYSAGVMVDRRGQAADRLIGHPVTDSEHMPIEVFAACGAAALYRRTMLLDLGGFDERFLFGLEDVDVAWRGNMRGWRCVYAPDAIVYHDLGATVAHGSELRFVQAGRNRLLLIAKNMTTRQLIRHGPGIILFDVLYVAYGLLRLRTLAPLRGRWAGLRLWRSVRRSGAPGRRAVNLARPTRFREVMRRRAAWRFATASARDPAEGPADLVAWK
jgi:GT2 family glycosyltransferase